MGLFVAVGPRPTLNGDLRTWFKQTTARKPAESIKRHGDMMPGWLAGVQLLHVMSALIWRQLVMSRLQPALLAHKSLIKPRRRGHKRDPSRTLCAPFSLCGQGWIQSHPLAQTQ